MIAPTRASAAALPPGRSCPSRRIVPGGRIGEPEQQPDQRGLAGAVGAEEPEGDAARHLEVDAVERRASAEALAEPARLDRECGWGGGGHAAKLRAGPAPCRRASGASAAGRGMNPQSRLIRWDERGERQRRWVGVGSAAAARRPSSQPKGAEDDIVRECHLDGHTAIEMTLVTAGALRTHPYPAAVDVRQDFRRGAGFFLAGRFSSPATLRARSAGSRAVLTPRSNSSACAFISTAVSSSARAACSSASACWRIVAALCSSRSKTPVDGREDVAEHLALEPPLALEDVADEVGLALERAEQLLRDHGGHRRLPVAQEIEAAAVRHPAIMARGSGGVRSGERPCRNWA